MMEIPGMQNKQAATNIDTDHVLPYRRGVDTTTCECSFSFCSPSLRMIISEALCHSPAKILGKIVLIMWRWNIRWSADRRMRVPSGCKNESRVSSILR